MPVFLSPVPLDTLNYCSSFCFLGKLQGILFFLTLLAKLKHAIKSQHHLKLEFLSNIITRGVCLPVHTASSLCLMAVRTEWMSAILYSALRPFAEFRCPEDPPICFFVNFICRINSRKWN